MPEEIVLFGPIWNCVKACIGDGKIAVTKEIYDEMLHITGSVGQSIKDHKAELLLEVGDPSWDFSTYIEHYNRMRKDHEEWIAEYSFKSPAKTICLPDLTAIALGKTLSLPVVSMESSAVGSPKHKRIPDICHLENVLHYSFNDFLDVEGMLSE